MVKHSHPAEATL